MKYQYPKTQLIKVIFQAACKVGFFFSVFMFVGGYFYLVYMLGFSGVQYVKSHIVDLTKCLRYLPGCRM